MENLVGFKFIWRFVKELVFLRVNFSYVGFRNFIV